MQLQPFGTFTAPLGRVEFVGDTPRGRRLIGPIVGARIDGEHLRADQRGTSAADWLLTGPDGATVIDVRISFRCDDGAFVQIAYTGRADWAGGVGSGPVYSAFRFETEDERYRWLHSRIVVGKGQVHPDHGTYDLFLLT
ncbi:hypothetical protein ASG88_11305 [Nocardioides sp. Soil777]|uniref:DUF3237 domain-containing protein n=1 Tax=Nocardioides sp. Soil777 TaxID=1736409 RepID=UPI00070278CB|nr:DUF3237 domain-containing protein [Nocardioides sp. Soil777]KRF00978.1 hypothetical protein ASG88_11305 [Nocardioides sp. Soil777]